MPEADEHDVTMILAELRQGDGSAIERLLPLVYEELRAIASGFFRHERAEHTLQPTALVHEAYLKLVHQDRAQWQDRAHFFAVASTLIRRILVDHARRSGAGKRGGAWRRLTISDAAADDGIGDDHDADEVDVERLDAALTRLRDLSERQSRVVELRFFGGLNVEQAALVLDVSPRTVKGDWRVARAWLRRELGEGAAP